MVMKHTILSQKELSILEAIISRLGYVVYFEDIKKLLVKDYSSDEIKKQISLLSKRGWLVRIKRGVFAVATLESHSFASVSPYMVSQVLVPESYVSFEFALANYGLFDQLPKRLTAVTPIRPKQFSFQNTEYRFVKIKSELFFGFQEARFNNHQANIAELEKTILDFLYFRTDTYSLDIVLEKLRSGEGEFDFKRLYDYAAKYPLSVRRRLGFLLDLAGADTGELHQKVRQAKGFSKLTRDSNIFNAKWRIYYEDRFTE